MFSLDIWKKPSTLCFLFIWEKALLLLKKIHQIPPMKQVFTRLPMFFFSAVSLNNIEDLHGYVLWSLDNHSKCLTQRNHCKTNFNAILLNPELKEIVMFPSSGKKKNLRWIHVIFKPYLILILVCYNIYWLY